MSEMVPGLHENTRPQRKGHDGAWANPGDDAFEPCDAPPKWVGLGIAGLLGVLVLSVGGVLWFAEASKPRVPIEADAARARFHAPAPALEVHPPSDRVALERAHPAPGGPSLDTAIAAVVARGWGEDAPPPGRGETAMQRAEAGP